MSSTTTGPTNSTGSGNPPSPQEVRAYLAGKHICPFCGTLNESADGPCARCRMEDTPATRKATKVRIGPWYVLHSRNPSAPGMKFDTLLSLVRKGQVSPRSIVRGPTTQQLWKFAAGIKGLSREFGLCYHCGEGIERDANFCPHCNRLQETPLNPDALLEIDESSVAAPLAERPPIERPVRRPPPMTPAPLPAPEPAAPTQLEPPTPQPVPTPSFPPPSFSPPQPTPAPTPRPRGLLDDDVVVATQDDHPTPPAPQQPPPRSPEWKHEGKILSPEDLAAAFKIELKPGSGSNRTSAPAPKKSHGFRNFVLAVIVFGAIGSSVVFAIRPDLRNAALTWAEDRFDAAKRFVMAKPALPPPPTQQNSPMTSASPRPAPTPESTPTVEPDLPDATTSSHLESPTAVATTNPPPAVTSTPIPTPPPTPTPRVENPPPVESSLTTAPAAAPAARVVEAAAPYPTTAPAEVAPTPAPAPVPVVKVETPPAPKPKPAAADLPKAISQARTLWYEAFDAEQRRDFAAAAKLYGQIKELPEGAWPAGLQLRLDRAQKAADKGQD